MITRINRIIICVTIASIVSSYLKKSRAKIQIFLYYFMFIINRLFVHLHRILNVLNTHRAISFGR